MGQLGCDRPEFGTALLGLGLQRVESGLDVVDRIALGPSQEQLAVDPVVILSVDVQR